MHLSSLAGRIARRHTGDGSVLDHETKDGCDYGVEQPQMVCHRHAVVCLLS